MGRMTGKHEANAPGALSALTREKEKEEGGIRWSELYRRIAGTSTQGENLGGAEPVGVRKYLVDLGC